MIGIYDWKLRRASHSLHIICNSEKIGFAWGLSSLHVVRTICIPAFYFHTDDKSWPFIVRLFIFHYKELNFKEILNQSSNQMGLLKEISHHAFLKLHQVRRVLQCRKRFRTTRNIESSTLQEVSS